MNKAEMAKLLTVTSAFRGKALTAEDIEAWHAIVGDLDFADAVEAARRHLRESEAWLMPVHLVEGVKRIHYERSRIRWADRQLAAARDADPLLDEWRWWSKLAREDGVSAFTREYAQRQADSLERKALNA